MPELEHEKRKEMRYPFARRIKYSVNDDPSGNAFDGVAVNVSNSGLCLYVYKPLEIGVGVLLKGSLPTSCKKAEVRWIKKIDDDYYMAGFNCFEGIETSDFQDVIF